jgi:hypothetical protein
VNTFFEIIFDLITTFIPWPSKHEDRSIVGESDLDRRSRKIAIISLSVFLILAVAVGAWPYFYK